MSEFQSRHREASGETEIRVIAVNSADGRIELQMVDEGTAGGPTTMVARLSLRVAKALSKSMALAVENEEDRCCEHV